MFTSENGFQQAYNLQASVCKDSCLILGGHITPKANDKQEMIPALEGLKELPEQLGKARRLSADNGYFSEDNVTACENDDIIPCIATGREEHHPS